MENGRELEKLPEELRHDGKLLPLDLWSFRQAREHWEVFAEAYPEEADRMFDFVWADWASIASFDVTFGEAVDSDASFMAAFRWMERTMRLAGSDWPKVPEKKKQSAADTIEDTWSVCAELVRTRGDVASALEALNGLEKHFSSEVEQAERELKQLSGKDDFVGEEALISRVSTARVNFSNKRYAITRFRRKFAMTFEVPKLSEQDVREMTKIGGYNAPGHAREARAVLKEHPRTSSFTELAAQMGDPMVNGGSKVDTLKRRTGYDDLPIEKKSFERFKEMLFSAEIT